MLDMDTRFEITPAGEEAVREMKLGFMPTARGRAYALPLIQAAAVFAELQRRNSARLAEEQEALRTYCLDCGPRCGTCGDTGEVSAGFGGNSDITTNCPDCTPDYR